MNLDIDEKNQQAQDTGDIELPHWVGRLLRFMYLGAGLFLMASSLTLMGCSSVGASEEAVVWQPATEVLSAERSQAIIATHSSALSEAEQASVRQSMQVTELGEGMQMIDFNNALLTGRLGSLYVIYDRDGDRIFNRYLNPKLPDGVPVVQRSDRSRNGYPCFIVNDVTQPTGSTAPGIAQTTLCYDGVNWIDANTEVVDVNRF